MNKKGQTLIAFLCLLPILILLLAFTVDVGLILKEYTKLNSTTRTILKTTYQNLSYENYEEKIKALYEENKIDTKNLKIKNEPKKIEIEIEYKKESIFGTIIGIKNYPIKLKMVAEEKDNQLIINKE